MQLLVKCAAIVILAGVVELAPGQAPDRPFTVVCLGDSITGVYYHTGGRRAYPEMLALALERLEPARKVKVVNAGISGHTTREGLARLERDVLRHQPDVVTISFGMNDVARVPQAEFRKNLEELVARCRKAGARVVLCTPNTVMENAARPNAKLAEFAADIRALAAAQRLSMADFHSVYLARQTKAEAEWRFLMSDAIHPNMAGHKLLAEILAHAIAGKEVSLADAGPPTPALPHTRAIVKGGRPIKVLAMAPYDQHIGPALQAVVPGIEVQVEAWPTAGQTMAQLEEAAKKVRKVPVDLVLVAPPYEAGAPTAEQYRQSLTWVLNSSLSFGVQQWDVAVVPPAMTRPPANDDERRRDALIRRVCAAQDLTAVVRAAGEETAAPRDVLIRWLRQELKP